MQDREKSSDYWQERFRQMEEAQNRASVEQSELMIEQYERAERKIAGKINAWYQRFADNNGITMTEAKRMLNAGELRELKWDVQEYIAYGRESAISQAWVKELENASAKIHIRRLEALNLQIQQEIEALYGNCIDSIDAHIRKTYSRDFYHTAFELHKGFGVGARLTGLDDRLLDRVVSKPWAIDGKNFSERLWGNKTRLVNELHNSLSTMCITGESPQRVIDAFANKMKASRQNTTRLIMTESAVFANQARVDCMKELGVEEYEVLETLDGITCEFCQKMDKKHFKLTDFKVGVTAPVFHPNCRGCTCPYFEDEFTSIEERAARGWDGKTYYVPADITYKEWRKSFVDGDKSSLQEIASDDIIKAQEEVKQAAEKLKVENFPSSFTAKGELKNTQALVDYVNSLEGADANVVALFNRMGKLENIESNGIPFTISHAKNHAVSTSTYTMTGNIAEAKLTIPKLQGDDLAGQVHTTLHEEMHLMDLYGRQDPQKSKNWFSTSRKPLVDVFKQTSDSMSESIVKLFNEHNAEFRCIHDEIGTKYQKMISELNDSVMNRRFKGNYNREYKKIKEAMKLELDYHCRNIMGGGIGNLQDIYDALSGGAFQDAGKVIYGHGSSYYQYTESRIHETIANYAALSVTRPDLIILLRADKPDLVAELDETIIELLRKAGE